jgi:hypothetical protein
VQAGRPPTRLQTLHSATVDRVASIIVDVDHDGSPELVIPRGWGTGARYQCDPEQHVIYTCDQSTCSDTSTRFPEFYARELEQLDGLVVRKVASGGPTTTTACDARSWSATGSGAPSGWIRALALKRRNAGCTATTLKCA